MFKTRIDLTGKRFGRWMVIDYGRTEGKRAYWKCKCDCGTVKMVSATNLKSGATKSCGCLNAETIGERSRKHGLSGTRLYICWENMLKRCLNPRSTRYSHYGGRGIKVCDDWKSFSCFKDWAFANGYTDVLTIERVDANRDYEPSNCKWIPLSEQSKNRRYCKSNQKGGE